VIFETISREEKMVAENIEGCMFHIQMRFFIDDKVG
jgi:hypothetical protein